MTTLILAKPFWIRNERVRTGRGVSALRERAT
jgi:hypothetical protein